MINGFISNDHLDYIWGFYPSTVRITGYRRTLFKEAIGGELITLTLMLLRLIWMLKTTEVQITRSCLAITCLFAPTLRRAAPDSAFGG